MSIAFTKKEEEEKENSIKKKTKKTVEIFLDKVRSSVPGAEGQELHQCNVNVKLDYMYNFLIKKKGKHLTTKYGLFRLHTQNTVLYQIFSPGPSSFSFS